MPNGMATNKITYQTFKGAPSPHILELLISCYQSLFEDADVSFFKARIDTHPTLLTILAFEDQNLIGFKIGYPYNENTFYSWIGGVLPTYRRLGIASKLAELQEHYAIQSGFKRLRTKSMNTYKPMMILNLKNGFDITKFYSNSKGQTKIVFEKDLILN